MGGGAAAVTPAAGHGSEPSLPAMQVPQAASGSFDAIQQTPPPKRSVLKIILFVFFALLFLASAAAVGLWISLDGDFSRLGGSDSSESPEPIAPQPEPPVNQVETPVPADTPEPTPSKTPDTPVVPGSDTDTPGQPGATEGQLEQWRSAIQIARNEREVGQAQRSRDRLMAVIDEIEQRRPSRDSADARLGVEACLLLGEIELASIGMGAADSTNYVDRLSTEVQNVTRHYQRAWRLGVTEMEQCVFGGMARAAERAAEACGRAAGTPGIGEPEAARRRSEAQRYLTVARDHYQRAVSVRESSCREQVEAGLARVGAALPSQPSPGAAPAPSPTPK